ncbi:MAG: hypothetical protein ACRDJH_00010 [Thermomicrobiales bacterium]
MLLTTSRSLVQRMIGAARFDAATYEEVARERTATPQGAIIVALSVVASAIGAIGDEGLTGIVAIIVVGPTVWVIYALSAYFVGTELLATATAADIGRVLRALAFAATPSLLAVFSLILALESILPWIVIVWSFAASIVALRQALMLSTARAATAAILAGVVQVILWVIIAVFLGLAAETLIE